MKKELKPIYLTFAVLEEEEGIRAFISTSTPELMSSLNHALLRSLKEHSAEYDARIRLRPSVTEIDAPIPFNFVRNVLNCVDEDKQFSFIERECWHIGYTVIHIIIKLEMSIDDAKKHLASRCLI